MKNFNLKNNVMKEFKLKELLKIKNGKDHKNIADGNIPIYGSGGIMRYGNQSLYEKESILLPRKGTLNNIQFSNKPFWTVDTLYYTEIDKSLVEPYFLYNYLKMLNLENLNTGTGVPSMTFDSYYNLTVQLPELEVQKKIADILSDIDNKISINNSLNDNLEQQAKTLYDYWFVQNANPKWEIVTLNNFIKSDKSGDWGKEEGQGNYITRVECIRGADINGIIGKGEMKTPTRFILEKNRNKILSENDLVIEISGGSPTQSTGRLAYITTEVLERFENPLICSNFCKAISLNNPNELFYFVYSWNKAYENNVFFGFEGKTSGIKNLLFETLVSTYSIVKPDEKTLIEFQKVISTLEKQRQKNLQQNQQLSQLRDWLLPMLMNGQVKVE